MKAWQYVGDGVPIALNEVAQPTAGAGEVVLDVKGAGICHSDVSFLNGSISSLLGSNPITLGHEVAGVVTEVGPGVTGWTIGDKAAVNSVLDGLGVGRHGGFAAKVAAPTELLVPVPDGVAWDQAAVSVDAGATSFRAVIGRAGTRLGDKVGIIGFGGLGSLGVQAAVAAGADVYVVETNEDLHEEARQAGAVAVAGDIKQFAGEDLDAVVDFAGFGVTTADSIHVVKRHGRIVLVGQGRNEGTLDLLTLMAQRIDLLGSMGGSNDDNLRVLKLMASGRLRSRTTCISFDEIGEAVETLARGGFTSRFAVIFD